MKQKKIIIFLSILCTLYINTQFSENEKNQNTSKKNTVEKFCPLRKVSTLGWCLVGGVIIPALIVWYYYKYPTVKKSSEEENILNITSIKPEEKNNVTIESIDSGITITEEIIKDDKVINDSEEIITKTYTGMWENARQRLITHIEKYKEAWNKEGEDDSSDKESWDLVDDNFQHSLF